MKMTQRQQNPEGNDQNHTGSQPKAGNVPDVDQTLNDLDAASKGSTPSSPLGTVHIEHGANDLDVSVAGFKVGKVRNSVKSVLNIGDNAKPYVNGQQVGESYELKAGDQLEFMKESGQKG